MIGAGTCKKKRSGRDLRQHMPVQLLISPKTRRYIVSFLNERRRIENDEVIRKIGGFEKFEKVCLDELMVGKSI